MATANLLQTSVSGGTQNALSLQGDGVFFPKASTTSRLALTLTTTDKGFIVYDTTDNNIYFWNGAAWESVPSSGDAGVNGAVQYNDNGIVSGASNFTYNKATGLVSLASATITGDLTVDTSTLKVDSANDRVGIKTATPRSGFALDVLGNAALGNSTTTTSIRLKLDCVGTAGNVATMSFAAAGTNKVFYGLSGGFLGDTSTDALIATDAAGASIRFFVSDTAVEVARFNSTGNLAFANGKGIDFSAKTPDGSGTVGSEVLNDYEEGTWTPVATGLTNVGAVTYNATYTKIGRVVYINLKVNAVTSTTSVANTTYFSGLPFTPALNSTITAVNEGNLTSLGVGLIATGSTVFTPNWTAVQNATLSGFYYV